MFIQAAIDAPDLARAEVLVRKIVPCSDVDFIEIGASLIKIIGIEGVRNLTKFVSPDRLYVDLKTIDFPEMEIMPFVEIGIRRFSILMGLEFSRLEELQTITSNESLSIFVSTMGYPIEFVVNRTTLLSEFGFSKIICHGSGKKEDAFKNVSNQLDILAEFPGLSLVAAGGISLENIIDLRKYDLFGIIVGRFLMEAEDPCAEAAGQIRTSG